MKKTVNVIIAGVGGQGNIVASKILGEAALAAGFDVKITETHGMAQRGGAVHSMIRFGEVVYSPIVPQGSSDYLLSFEILEGLRWVHYLKENGWIIVSTEVRPPYQVSLGKASYPENIEEIYAGYGNTLFVPAKELAAEAGSVRSANIVMLGAFACFEKNLNVDLFKEAIRKRFSGKDKVIEINLKAFEKGFEFALNAIKEGKRHG